MPKLTDEQIKHKLTEGRNYKRLYSELKVKYDELKAENKQLKQELLDQRQYFELVIETQAAQITELQTMVFSRKGKPRSGGGHKAPSQPRDAASYRRQPPTEKEITSEEHHAIDACKHCHGPLTDKEDCTRFVEDIILAALNTSAQFKTVEKHIIERGYCVPCGKYSSARDLRGQEVSLGPNVRTLVCYLVTLRDHSYDQVINLLWDLYRFKITDGEITNILDDKRLELLPEYERLKEHIRAGPAVHMDESRWRIQSEHAGYAWSMSSTTSTDVVFKLADSRGKGNAEELLGENFQGVGITDRYSAYKHLFWLHQICWAHLQRTAKDLTHLECLSPAKLKHVTKFYQQLAAVYAAIRSYQEEPYNEANRKDQAAILLTQVTSLCQPHELDPKKLKALKAGILDYQASLFICLTVDGIPADNNRAERDIKQLVMKRRKSLGSKTTKGARILEVLLSVCLSTYNRDRDNFFVNFRALTA
jgi:transposase